MYKVHFLIKQIHILMLEIQFPFLKHRWYLLILEIIFHLKKIPTIL